MTHRPQYELTIHCPRCGDEIEAQFVEVGRYEFAPIVDRCLGCGFDNQQELDRLAMDADDVEAERYGRDG